MAETADDEALRRCREELARSRQEYDRFVYAVSHDLREPMRAIRGFGTLLQRAAGHELTGHPGQLLTSMLDGADRLDDMLDDLLRFSRIGRPDQDPQPTDLQELAAASIEHLRSTGAAEGATIELAPLPTVVGRPRDLAVLFDELLDNACKFRPPQSPVQVRVHALDEPGEVVLMVDDDGVGIPAEHRARAVEVFQRLHTRDEFPGTGIGLALCDKAARSMGGELRLEDGPRGGLRATVRLPRA